MRPWGRAILRRWLLTISVAVSVLLVVYGAPDVSGGALVLSGAVHPAGAVDRHALCWHVGFWDLWFLVWGSPLAVATAGYRRRTAERSGH